MVDPWMTEVANALAGKVAEAAFDGGRKALDTLARLVRDRFAREPRAAAALAAAQAPSDSPDSGQRVRDLEAALERVAKADDDFARRLRTLWTQITVNQTTGDDGVNINSTGAIGGSQFQGRNIVIQGGVTHYAPPVSNISVPRQLPPDVTHFTGRESDLAKLDALLGGERAALTTSVVISAVAGAAGIGKTALAVHWAHRAAWRFSDGQLYVNLRGYDPGPPMTATQALDGFLRALEVTPERIPTDVDAQAGLFRTLLSARRMLIVLDNARSAGQVRPLLPGTAGCLVLVTSRSHMSGLVARDGAQRLTLDALAPQESLALLRSIIGAERVDAELEAANYLARRCVHLPLALRIAAQLANARPRTTLADLAAQLAEGPDRLDALATNDEDETTAVRAVFSWSVHSLNPQAARAFRLLGLHKGADISIPAAAVLTDSSPAQARRLLDALAEAHLLDTDSDRYHFHDLLRDYAAERAMAEESEEDRTSAIRRLLASYLAGAQSATRWLAYEHKYSAAPGENGGSDPNSPFRTRDDAAKWLKAELDNLVAATRQATESGDNATAWQLPNAMWSFYLGHWSFDAWITTAEIGLAATRRLGNCRAEANMLSFLASAYHFSDRPQEALQRHQQALDIHRQIGPVTDDDGLYISTAMILVNLGGTYGGLGQYENAIDALSQALPLARELGDGAAEGHALESLAGMYLELERFEEALDCLQQALTVFRGNFLPTGEAITLNRLAEAYLALDRVEKAAQYSQMAVDIQYSIQDEMGEASSLTTLALILRKMNQPEAANRAWQRAVALLDENDVPQTSSTRVYLSTAASNTTQEPDPGAPDKEEPS